MVTKLRQENNDLRATTDSEIARLSSVLEAERLKHEELEKNAATLVTKLSFFQNESEELSRVQIELQSEKDAFALLKEHCTHESQLFTGKIAVLDQECEQLRGLV